MSTTTYDLHVIMADGSEWDVRADQRDVAKFEREPFGCSVLEVIKEPFTFARYLAWNAGKRAKLHSFTWAEFDDEQCVDADSVEAPEADPGSPAPSAGN